MKRMIIAWTLLILIIFTGLTFIGFRIKKETINDLMEEELVKQTEKYLGLYTNLYPTLGNQIKITAEKLSDEGYDANLETNCTGYVIIKNTEFGFKYKAYIKCPEYTTKGFVE